ncbi:MAG: Caffeyl-CoA reductase-Etf complex subunit CarD [candidate division WS2 bacterium]|uniref:Electron transfer flavoprotein subunit beta n=1 Tax=Psychracetigena formicireducens TaxID=2986056 RepID=A0A9E2BK83_PSYF1|nr:Caffeyl-CoA reductase-Etf complex subunit CarD [Candidatus Psychracetigena formicireducens]
MLKIKHCKLLSINIATITPPYPLQMKILVCISNVPDTVSKISFTDNNTKFNTAGVQFIIGPYDDYALAKAVEIKEATGGKVVVLNVGLAETEPTIRKALAIGADEAIRVDAHPSDGWFVANQIAEIARKDNYDLILMGRESIDYNGGQVHSMVGELLGIPSISPVMELELTGNTAKLAREIEGGKEYLQVNTPFVAGCQEPIAEWKIPNMRGIMSARTKPLAVIPAVNIDLSAETINYELPPAKAGCKMFLPDEVTNLVSALKSEAKVI